MKSKTLNWAQMLIVTSLLLALCGLSACQKVPRGLANVPVQEQVEGNVAYTVQPAISYRQEDNK